MKKIFLGTVDINDQVRKNVKKCIDEERIGQGKFIEEFEKKVADFVQAKYAVAVCNGTMADLISLLALKQMRPGKDEVIVPALTFVAHVNSIIAAGLKPVFVDVGFDLQMNCREAEKKINENTLAVMPAHLLGVECGWGEYFNESDIFILEDACECFGIFPNGIGATYSFFPSHTITTGEGGMIVTGKEEFATLCREIRNHGRKNSNNILQKFHFDIYGLNGKMSNLIAAVGAALIGDAHNYIIKRNENVEYLNKGLGCDWFQPFSPHAYPYLCKNKKERDKKILRCEQNGIEVRKLFSCLPVQEKVYKKMGLKEKDFPVAMEIGKRGMYVPCHQGIDQHDLDRIINVLRH